MRNPLARCIWTRKRVAKLHLDRIRAALLSSRALREESAMNADFELEVRSRDLKGKGSSRRLRRSGKTPAVIYGGGVKPTPITLDNHALAKQMEQEAFFTSILNIVLDGNPQAAGAQRWVGAQRLREGSGSFHSYDVQPHLSGV